jgi:hypothetical protein
MSNVSFEAPDGPPAPKWVKERKVPELVFLTDAITDRMEEAVNYWDDTDVIGAGERLKKFFLEVNKDIGILNLWDIVDVELKNPPSFKDLDSWLYDGCGDSLEAMIELLHRLRATSRVIGAALFLRSVAISQESGESAVITLLPGR